jgi:hypothetical protein
MSDSAPLHYPPAAGFKQLDLTIWVSAGLVCGYLLSSRSSASTDAANKFLPIVFIAICIVGALRTVRRNRLMAASPIVTFLLACAVYFGLGPLLYHFGPEANAQFADVFHPVSRDDLLRVNLINTLGVFITCFIFRRYTRPVAVTGTSSFLSTGRTFRHSTAVFLMIGLGATYLLILPYELGMLPFTLSGVLYNLRAFTYMGIFLLSYSFASSKRGKAGVGTLLATTLVLHTVPALLTFGKLPVVLALGALAGGWFLARPQLKVVLVFSVVLVLTYLYLVPFISGGRHIMGGATADITIGERTEIARESSADLGGVARGVHQVWWVRLNYAPNQTFAMKEYDQGRPGTSFAVIPYLFVPRILFPGKPIVSNIGGEFNNLISGNPNSSSSPTTFAEAYWNGGWPYFLLVTVYLGILFAKLTNATLRGLAANDLRWLPAAYFGALMGARIDSWFVETFAGSVLFLAVYWIMLHFLIGRQRVSIAAPQSYQNA